VQGYKPNLDMVAEPESGDWLFAENKCLEYRREIDSLASALVDDHVRLASLSYRELWSHWEGLGDAALADHVAALRSRYDVALGAIA
jgi:hypothetical protein